MSCLKLKQAEEFQHAVAALNPMIRAAGGIPVLYETWAYREGSGILAETGMAFAEMQQGLTAGYAAAAKACDGLLAPVGQAFNEARALVNLYCDDDYHPSDAGSTIAAQIIANVIRAHQATL